MTSLNTRSKSILWRLGYRFLIPLLSDPLFIACLWDSGLGWQILEEGREAGSMCIYPVLKQDEVIFLVDRVWPKSCGSAAATALRPTTDFKVAERSLTGHWSKERTTCKFRTGSTALSPLVNSPLGEARDSEEVQETSGARRSFDAYSLYRLVSQEPYGTPGLAAEECSERLVYQRQLSR
jgi:hypothetical protein